MNENAKIIVALCSHIDSDAAVKPLEPREWSVLAAALMERNLEPQAIPDLSTAELDDILNSASLDSVRILRLLDRAGSLTFALNKLENAGIYVVTRADHSYPKRLKKSLGNSCPPLFYFAGSLDLLDRPSVGFAGSRSVGDDDTHFTEFAVGKAVENGYCVVSGGAKGVDSIAEAAALNAGSAAVSYLSDSMLRKIKLPQHLSAIQDGRLLLLSAVNPDAGFHAGTAMMRNRYIYAQGQATVVIRADYNKGGTWTGAKDCIKHKWSPVLCWNNKAYQGNQALIQQGAIPIDERWDGDVSAVQNRWDQNQPEQLSFFS